MNSCKEFKMALKPAIELRPHELPYEAEQYARLFRSGLFSLQHVAAQWAARRAVSAVLRTVEPMLTPEQWLVAVEVGKRVAKLPLKS